MPLFNPGAGSFLLSIIPFILLAAFTGFTLALQVSYKKNSATYSPFFSTSKFKTPMLAIRHLSLSIIGLISFTIVCAQNPIVTENALPGNPISEWGVPNFRDASINGFSTEIGVNRGQRVHFKIDVAGAANFSIKIYRIGYYGGNGARLITDLGSFAGTAQPAGLSDAVTGLLDCGNWSESAHWDIPSTAVSGLYIARLQRTGGGSNHIVFIVRDDASTSDVYLQTTDGTWQAYNGYGGNYFYAGTTGLPSGHASKISYNRPFFPYNAGFATDARQSDWYMNAEYPMIRWLERNGYDVSYTTQLDVARQGNLIQNHKIFTVSGHDEYVSKEQRDNIEAARAAGVNMAFFTGNEVYWKTRFENDASGNDHHTLVCYKEGTLADGTQGEATCGSKCDVSSPIWTGLWRMGGAFDAGRPENALTGTIGWDQTFGAITVPDTYKQLRFWRNTSVAALAVGQTATLAPNTLAYEWDFEQFPDSYPNGRITMSSTDLNNLTHKLSLYRHSSGGLVFGAGTIQWSWGLDGNHQNGTTTISQDMQQATLNLFADMGVQPGTKQPELTAATASTDLTAPTSNIVSPVTGTTVPLGPTVTISGNATDAGGGVVAGVEVSLDGGATWHIANITSIAGSTNWTYAWATTASGTFNVKSRGYDDSGNMENASAGISITVSTAVCPCTVFQPTDVPDIPLANDGQPIELGMRFRSTTNGFVTGVRFYKGDGVTGTHIGHLWTNTGVELAEATFTGETANGWQQVLFSTPVAITAGTTYVVSYHSSSGDFAVTNPYFTTAVINGLLRGLANGEDGPNGVYIYSATSAFPTSNVETSNYWVDVVFNQTASPDITPPVISNIVATAFANGTATITWTTDEASDSKVDYGTSAGTLNQSSSNGLMSLNHSITLTGLSNQTTYFFRVSSTDPSGNSATAPVPPATLNFLVPAGICFQDLITADFSAGTADANTYISTKTDGEVILKPGALSSEFSTLPSTATWDSHPWVAGGNTSVSGGILLVNGARFNTEPQGNTFGPGSSIEFAATFIVRSEHIGFGGGTDVIGTGGIFNGEAPWAIFSTGNGAPQITARTFDGVSFSDVVIPGSFIGTSHIYRIEWTTAGHFNYYIDGTLVNTETGLTITSGMRPAMSDDLNDASSLSVDWIHISPYATSATFTSRVFDAGVPKDWGTASWTADVPAGTTLQLSQRKGNTPTPDVTWTAFTTIASNGATVGGTSRYIQYKADFATSDPSASPVLKDVGITCGTAASLPVELINFRVVKQGTDAQLLWTTASEQNNKGFEIQRSVDGANWSVAGFVNGVGNSTANVNYQYLDKNLATGKYYYRLRQVDIDGRSKFSPVVTVTFSNHLSLELLQNHPNPFNSTTVIDIVVPQTGRIKLMLYDQMGRLVQQLMDEVKNPGSYQVQMNRKGLGAGIYYYKLDSKDQSLIKKMTIL